MTAAAAGLASNLTLTLPLVVFVCLGLLCWDGLARLHDRLRRDEFDEDTTLADWQASRRPHLSLLDQPEAK